MSSEIELPPAPAPVSPRLAQYVDRLPPPTCAELPLVHSSRCELFATIAASDSIEPQTCEVFGERLIYLFYGRPVYRSETRGARPSTETAYCPICFVFKPGSIVHLARVFPCDSGGIAGQRFNPPIDAAERDNFALTATLDSARRLARQFFETNEKYYWGEASGTVPIPATETDALKYYHLIRTKGESDFDQRRSAVEVQTADRISLVDNLHFVILPTGFLEEPDVRETILRRWRGFPITYRTAAGGIPRECSVTIQTELEKFLKQGGFL